eukprot:TRINITY_DN1277_c0_g1_i1.p2 TRINITY_DN1277_c0_g1~~TRINITY_DN1277_c0_g1_i1.p2  ORF type:complete len:146 (-),score=34.75 TRINITY_DN1277_c0_g1_i1:258-695(-)
MAQRHELVLRFEAFPEVSLSLVLLRGVKNHAALQQAMLGGELDCAFICPALVRDPFLIHTAAYAALCAHSNNKLRTRNIHSELVVSLSPTRNITKSLSAFGRVGSDMIVGVFSLSSQKVRFLWPIGQCLLEFLLIASTVGQCAFC